MIQAVLAYGLVALAVGWIVWSQFLPSKLKARLRGRTGTRPLKISPRRRPPTR